MHRAWIAAVLAAAVLAATALAGCQDAPDPEQEVPSGLWWPFPEVVLPSGHDYSLFVQWNSTDPAPTTPIDTYHWITERSGLFSGTLTSEGLDWGDLHIDVAPAEAPRFGIDGHNATKATIYVFIDTDEMLGYSEDVPLQELNRILWLYGSPIEIPADVYYLGDGDAPDGTQPLPWYLEAFRPAIVDLLHGLPVGGVASAIVPEEDADLAGQIYGDLYVTARIDALVQAP